MSTLPARPSPYHTALAWQPDTRTWAYVEPILYAQERTEHGDPRPCPVCGTTRACPDSPQRRAEALR